MALQVVLVNDASPGALQDAGITSDGTDLTSTLGWAGTTGTFSSTLGVTGNATFGGTMGVTGNVAVNTDKFTVTAASGNTAVAGTLAVTGASTLTGAVGCAASVTLGAGADLLGSSTSDITINTDKFTVAGATGNTAVAGTLGVTGVASFAAGVAMGATENAATNGAVVVPITKAYQGYTTNSTAAIAATLADGAVGQRLHICLTLKDTNDMVLTPANLTGGTTLTFDATGEYVELMFVGSAWKVLHGTATLA